MHLRNCKVYISICDYYCLLSFLSLSDSPGRADDSVFDILFVTSAKKVARGFYARFHIFDSYPSGLIHTARSTDPDQHLKNLQCNFDPNHCDRYCFHGYVEGANGCLTCQCLNGSTGRHNDFCIYNTGRHEHTCHHRCTLW